MHNITKGLFASAVLFFASFTPALAQEGEPVAELSIENAAIVYQEENTIDVFFELVNGKAVQPNVRYAVQIMQPTDDGDRIWAEYTSDQVISLESEEQLHRNLSYTAPEWFDGTYEVRIIVENNEGLPLGTARVGEVSFEGTALYIDIDPSSCDFLYDYETPVELTCLATNYFETPIAASPLSEVYQKTTRGEGVGAFIDEERVYQFEPGETKEVSFFLEPQAGYGEYAAHALLVSSDGEDISNRVPYTYSTYASPAQIINVTANASTYEEGDEVTITVAYSAEETVSLALVLLDEKKQSCVEVTDGVRLNADETLHTIHTVAERSCENPVASIQLVSLSGEVVDESVVYLRGLSEEREGFAFRDYVPAFAVVVIIVLAYMLYRYTHREKHADTLTLGVLFVFLAFGITTGVASAASWSSSSSISGCTNYLSASINKKTYEVGSSIGASMSTSVSCNSSATVNGVPIGSVGNLKTKMYISTSGSSDSRTGIGGNGYGGRFGNGCCWSTTLTAPSTAGSYNVNFRSVNSTQEGTGYSSGRSRPPKQYVSHGSISGSIGYKTEDSTPPVPTASLTADPASIEKGDSSTLRSRCTNSTQASISRGVGSVSSTSGTTNVSPSGDTTYTLTCTGPGGNASDSATVRVTTSAPTASLSASPSSIQEGNTSRLQSRCTNSTSASIDQGVGSVSSTSGTTNVSPNRTTTYTLRCSGNGETATASTQVRVTATPPPPSSPNASISASPRRIEVGESTRVHWNSSNAVTCRSTSSPLTTGGDTSGYQNITFTRAQTKTFSVVCENSGGDTDSASTQVVVVNASDPGGGSSPTASLEVRNATQDGGWTSSNIVIAPGDQINLRWDSARADSCSGSNFSTGGETDGTQNSVNEPSAGNRTTYSVTCTNDDGSDSASLRVSAETLLPEVTASDDNVRKGESVTVSYNMQGNDPAQCSLTGPGVSYLAGSFSQQTGSINTTISGDSIFTLTCPGGSAEVSVELIPVIFDS